MNKNIKLAVAGAVLALSASAANAGIIIPAGDWTLDINGNVNAFVNYTHVKSEQGPSAGVLSTSGGLAGARGAGLNADKQIGINTGLLPSWLGFTGTTRQNDVDVSFTISMQPNVSDQSGNAAGDAAAPLFRQSFLTFGDKSWGTIKLGKDIGIFASDAILNDMTLLGVGGGAHLSGAPTTLGGIGNGYIYAGWKGQAAYTTPNFNGFQATVGITNPNQLLNAAVVAQNQDRYGLEGKASYAWSADQFSGKVWVSGASYDVSKNTGETYTASVGDLGLTVNTGPFGFTGYYYTGKGVGTTILGNLGDDGANGRRSSDGGYLQATYKAPFGTKFGAAYGVSNLDTANVVDFAANPGLVKSNERITIGAYHPLTKHLNLVAEYNNTQSESQDNSQNESTTYSAGAILFF